MNLHRVVWAERALKEENCLGHFSAEHGIIIGGSQGLDRERWWWGRSTNKRYQSLSVTRSLFHFPKLFSNLFFFMPFFLTYTCLLLFSTHTPPKKYKLTNIVPADPLLSSGSQSIRDEGSQEPSAHNIDGIDIVTEDSEVSGGNWERNLSKSRVERFNT